MRPLNPIKPISAMPTADEGSGCSNTWSLDFDNMIAVQKGVFLPIEQFPLTLQLHKPCVYAVRCTSLLFHGMSMSIMNPGLIALIVEIVFPLVSGFVVILRCVSRIFFVRKFGADDWFAIFAWSAGPTAAFLIYKGTIIKTQNSGHANDS